jgi:hypothetical protein
MQSATDTGGSSFLMGANAELRGRALFETGGYVFNLGGTYARLAELTFGGGGGSAPTSAYAGTLGAHATWVLGPASRASFDATGLVASRLGVRADNLLAARDPFLKDRIEYAVDDTIGWSEGISRRTTLRFAGGYLGAGGVASPDKEAVGVDMHGVKASVGATYEASTRDYVMPELRFVRMQYYHAILDTDLDRGATAVSAGTATLGLTHTFSRRLLAGAAGGVTVATPPPIIASGKPIVAPDLRVTVTYASGQYRAVGSYAYAYTSLGPRIGFGQLHTGAIEVRLRPVRGARWRDLELRGVGLVAVGSAPVAAALLTVTTSALPPTTTTGSVTTFTTAAGGHLDIPIVHGVVFTTGFDLEFVKADLDPAPPGGQPPPLIAQVMSVGIAGIVSTDPRDRVRRTEGDVDERAAAGAAPVEVDVDATMQAPVVPLRAGGVNEPVEPNTPPADSGAPPTRGKQP